MRGIVSQRSALGQRSLLHQRWATSIASSLPPSPASQQPEGSSHILDTAAPTLSPSIDSVDTATAMATPLSLSSVAAVKRYRTMSNQLVPKLITTFMRDGRRDSAEKAVARGLWNLQLRTNTNDPVELLTKAVTMAAPMVDVGSYVRGGKMLRVPLPLSDDRSRFKAFQWILEAIEKKKESKKSWDQRFADEILEILEGRSSVLHKRAQVHREALTNRAYSHLRWGKAAL
jgi:small subunit ribosomal protein S7